LCEAEQGLLEDGHLEPVDDCPAVFFGFDQPGILEHGKMGGHGGFGDGKMVGQLTGGHGALAQELEHAAAGRIGKSFEDAVHESIFS
jgi:hypothetical protein